MKKKFPKVSIIIPVQKINEYIRESLPHILEVDWPNFEVLIFPDKKNTSDHWPKTKIIASGNTGPAEKRDLAILHASGDIFAFLDDDAYPERDWLRQAVVHFNDINVAAVGGPGVTPPDAGFWEQASGWVSASPVGAGPYAYRFLPGKRKLVDDYPSMNLLVRSEEFKKVGGFDSHFYPGEDTKLCLDLVNLEKKIVYEPYAVVYHHRRPLWLPHLKQNGGFGIHRGFFARTLPKTSAKPIYFFPSLLVLTLGFGAVSYRFNSTLYQLSLIALSSYVVLLTANGFWIGLSSKDIRQALVSIPAIVVTHIWYGVRFLQGFLFTRKLHQ